TISLLLIVPFTIPLIQNIGLTILQARNQMRFRSLLGLVAALVSLGLQIPLAKYYGGVGCALGVSVVLLLAQGVVMNVYYRVKQNIDIFSFWKAILKMSIMPCLVTLSAYFAIEQFTLNSWVFLGLGILAYLIIYLPLFFIFSMNEYERKLLLGPFQKVFGKNP
ncbi:MAG: polysaccharide biosynthesis C-terminal domain-containing protein, partial [Alphaproteobacteria bacterium]|nr:polysaccharide biosynthesis C-terminal domain-containing protein [Alphaproteobacteria bacterium]